MRTTPLERVAEVDRARQVAHEHERALEHTNEQRRTAVVVDRELLAEVADARLQLVLAHDDGPDRAEIHGP
jgi:hypothetical protein